MKKTILTTMVVLCSTFILPAQQFISISPDFGNSGSTITTIVTSSDFYFTWGSAPTPWGDFYMNQNGTIIYPSSVTVIDDDHLEAVWPLPSSAPIGNYEIIWNVFWTNFFTIPGGFNIDCIPPPATITPNPVYTCVGDSLLIQANTGTGYTYQWYRSGVLLPGATSSSYYATTSGYYKVRVSDSQGCSRFSAETYFIFITPPNAVITPSGNQTICQGGAVYLQSNYTSSQYQWFRNNIAISGATLINYAATDSGSYTVRLTNSYGCTKMSAPVQVSFGIVGGAPATITPQGPTTFCTGSSVLLQANTGSNYIYQWYKYGNAILGAVTSSYVATTTGQYKVRISYGSSGCYSFSATTSVTVLPPPQAILTLQGPSSICPGDSTLLQANTGLGYTYQWYKYSNLIVGATSSSYYAKQTGTYKVRVYNAGGCSKKSTAQHIQLLSAPSAVITPSGSTAICAGDSVILQANTGANLSYYWKKFSNVIAGATSSSYSANTAGKYRVVVTSSNGCSKTSAPVNVTIVCRESFMNENSDVKIFPNPVNDILHVTGSAITKIEIVNAEGKTVQTILKPDVEEIDISNYAPGLYLLIVHTENEIIKTKVMKR